MSQVKVMFNEVILVLHLDSQFSPPSVTRLIDLEVAIDEL